MRTTLYLPDPLLNQVKKIALHEGRTLTKFTEDALREAVLRRRKQVKKKNNNIPVSSHTGGVFPGINLDKTADLLEIDDPFHR